MRRSRWRVLLGVLVCTAVSAVHLLERASADQAMPVGSLHVSVRDSLTGKALALAEVSIDRVAKGRTDQSGQVWLVSIPEGRHYLECNALGYQGKMDTVVVHAAVELWRDSVTVQLQARSKAARSRHVTLTVFAADSTSGMPVSGALVTVREPGWYWSETHQTPEWKEETDTNGRARLQKIPSGIYNVQVCENSHELETLTVALGSHSSETFRTRLVYIGPPADGRRCEVFFKVSKSRER